MDASTIIFIHEYLTEFFHDKEDPISPPGVKDINSVESAAARPSTTVDGSDAYETPFMKAASLFHSIVGNHSFFNGNKRAALLSTIYYLSELGYLLDYCDDDEMYEFTRKVTAHEIAADRASEVAAIADWLEENSRKQQKGDKPMKLSELKEAIGRFGFQMILDKDYYRIMKKKNVITSIIKKGAQGAEDYDPAYVADLRKRLNLTPIDGIDSARFYGHKGITDELNEFMQFRVEVMKRLAKI